MFQMPKQKYTVEFKELAVKLARDGQWIAAVSRYMARCKKSNYDFTQPRP